VTEVNLDDALEALVGSDEATLRNAHVEISRALRERARERGDLEELVEEGFREGFDAKGMPRVPWTEAGIIICPGGGVEKSATSHDCTYISIGDRWTWDSDETLLHVVRRVGAAAKSHQRTVSLLDAREGLELDVVTSKQRQGVHQLQRSTSYTVSEGTLKLVTTRAVTATGPRW
jgi:hypothetical protein